MLTRIFLNTFVADLDNLLIMSVCEKRTTALQRHYVIPFVLLSFLISPFIGFTMGIVPTNSDEVKGHVIFWSIIILVIVLSTIFLIIIYLINRNAKNNLQTLNDTLENRIEERTQELQKKITEKEEAEEKLQQANQEYKKLLQTLKTGEQKYFNLVKYSPWGIAYYAIDGQVLEVNQALLSILASENEEVTLNQNLLTLQQAIDAGLVDSFRECINEAKVVTNECLYFSSWGKRMYMRYIFTPLLSDQGEVQNVLGTFEDITDRKNVEVTLKNSEVKLKEANASKDTFLSIIAHDIKTPFNAILGFSDLLNDGYDSYSETDKKDFIRNIFEAAEITLKILDNLLQWSRSQTGKLIIKPENINICAIITETIEFLKSSAEKKTITIISECNSDCMAFADEQMITTVIRNLLSNAIKFTFTGGKIRISIREFEKYLEITISDDGIGMKEFELKKLFSIEEKFSKEGTAREQGTGLGLILCKEFIEKNSGWIWAESKPGEGSSFKFTLPKEQL